MLNFGGCLLSSQNPTLGGGKKDYEGFGFYIKTSKQFLHGTHSNTQKQKGKPVPTSGCLIGSSRLLLLRQERSTSQKQLYSNSSLEHLFLLRRQHKATTVEYLEGLAPPSQRWTKLEKKVTPVIVISLYKTLLTKHLRQSWQEFRVQFWGSVSLSKL